MAGKKWNDDAVKVLAAYKDEVVKLTSFDATVAKSTLEKVTANLGIGTGKILQALRLSITGAGAGPDLMMIMEIIGKEEVVSRIDFALKTLKSEGCVIFRVDKLRQLRLRVAFFQCHP